MVDKEVIIAMRKAIKSNDLEYLKQAFANDSELINGETFWGTWLHDAASYGMYDVAKLLIEYGIDVNKRGGAFKAGPLTEAANHGNKDIVELLITHGAILDVSSSEVNPLWAAIYNGHIDVVKCLVENGIEVNTTYKLNLFKGEYGDAYAYAKMFGKTEIANYLKEILGGNVVELIRENKPVYVGKDISLESIRSELVVECKKVLNQWFEKHTDIYIASINCNQDLDYIVILANTISNFNEVVKDKDEELYYYYKYCECEWGLELTLSDLSYKLQAKCEEIPEEDFDELDNFRLKVQDICCEAAKEIKRNYPNIMITIMMEDSLTQEKRIEFFKAINCDAISSEYIEHIEEFA